MQPPHVRIGIAAVVTLLFVAIETANAQPWNAYADDLSNSVCDVVNAANAELVVLGDTGEIAIITGVHPVVVDWIVVDGEFVFYYDEHAGFIEFAEDGDGFRTLWWLAFDGTVVVLDDFTLEPFDSGLFPFEFFNIPCVACDVWFDPFDCGDVIVTIEYDGDFDGVDDLFDFCLDTPLGEFVDFDGCACFEIDSDGDGVDDCDDLCPFTPFGEFVDSDGCPCWEFDSDGDGVDDCDDFCPFTPFGEFVDFDGCACYEIDSDGDGIDDCDDFCPFTPFGDFVDFDGCACYEIDSDGDGVDDCDDLCFNTFPGVSVDFDGCEIIIIVDPPDQPVVIACGSFGMLTLMLTVCGLVSLGGWRRR